MERILTREELKDEVIKYLNENEEVYIELLHELDNYNSYLNDDRWYPMDELDELIGDKSPSEVLEMVASGFNINSDYFRFDIYGLKSSDTIEYDYDIEDVVEDASLYWLHIFTNNDFINDAVELLRDDDWYLFDDEKMTIRRADDDDFEDK